VHHELLRYDDVDALTSAAAEYVCEVAHVAVAAHGTFNFAVSGGTTPWAMFNKLTALHVPWEDVVIYQVDERVAPLDDPARNLTNQTTCFAKVSVSVKAMPVNNDDLEAATQLYGRELPERFDLIHLGLGSDGHTASLLPGDSVLDVDDRPVALSGPYQGHRRMTLTYPALALADQILWLVAGRDKANALSLLLRADPSIPAGRVAAAQTLVIGDAAATPQ
jgi:6-phosphogluconolactonase